MGKQKQTKSHMQHAHGKTNMQKPCVLTNTHRTEEYMANKHDRSFVLTPTHRTEEHMSDKNPHPPCVKTENKTQDRQKCTEHGCQDPDTESEHRLD